VLNQFIQRISAATRVSMALDPEELSRSGAQAPAANDETAPLFRLAMRHLAGELDRHGASIHAVSGAFAALSEGRTAAVPRGPDRPGSELVMIVADVRSRSAFVSGAVQSLEAAIGGASRNIAELAGTEADTGVIAAPAAEVATRLIRARDQIGEVIAFIDKVALQRNVLALGAAVEAARAADAAGLPRLALVGGQVHALAQQAEQLTRDVDTLVAAIIEGAHDACGTIDQACAVLACVGEPERRA
jgi:methyl-accepting chemotaxis protein